MPGKVVLEITKGALTGQRYTYEEPDRVIIGHQEDCNIVVPESTVSRYHCLLDIRPPEVVLQDFGSLNGTFLNGEKVGQRRRDQTAEDAREETHPEVEMHDGDLLRLGKRVELKCGIDLPEPGPVLDVSGLSVTVREDNGGSEMEPERNPAPKPQPKGKKKTGAKKKAQAEKPSDDGQKKKVNAVKGADGNKDGKKTCANCGKPFIPTSQDNNLCPSCLADRAKVLDSILAALLADARAAEKKDGALKASPVGGYDKIALLGKGGMGEVWKVKERKTGKIFALKTMLPEDSASESARKLFVRESGICKCLTHKNVVRAYEIGSANGVFYILMDLCEGGSVDALMKKNGGKLSLELSTYIILQVLSGLDYVHNMDVDVMIKKGFFGGTKEVQATGVVHRDFKPGNILLTGHSDHPVAKVADFGMAKAFQTAGLSGVSQSGATMGTPPFMPRQQALRCKYAKPDVDVWAAAASYYNMLTGQVPKNFPPGKNPIQVIITESAVPIRQRNSGIPERLAKVIDKALADKPEIGIPTAADFRREIVAALPQGVRNYCKDVLI